MPKLFWPTAQIPNLLAVTQMCNLFNFGQYKLFIDYIFSCLTYRNCVQNPRSQGRRKQHGSGAATANQNTAGDLEAL